MIHSHCGGELVPINEYDRPSFRFEDRLHYSPYRSMPEGTYYCKTCADAAETFLSELKHVKGRSWSGQKIDYMNWQRRIIRDVYGTMNSEGKRQFQEVYVEIPRKQGKSTFCAANILFLLVADGEPGPEVLGAAYDRSQSSLIYDICERMVYKNTTLKEILRVVSHTNTIKYPEAGGYYKATSKQTKNLHGKNLSAAVIDEFHTQRTREMYDVITTSVGSREEPLIWIITTAGYSRETICWEKHRMAKQVINDEIDMPRFYPVVFSAEDYLEANEENSWRDEWAWYEANPGLEHPETGTGFRKIDEIRNKAIEAEHSLAFQNTFKRLYLNIWTQSSQSFIDPQKWANQYVDYDETHVADVLKGIA